MKSILICIVRAKAKIRDARTPYEVPSPHDLHERQEAILQVIYLVFTEGYSASSGGCTDVTRSFGRQLLDLLSEPVVMGHLALMLLQESRRAARTATVGDLVL